MSEFCIRQAQKKDSQTILDFIKKIAEYEIMIDQVECSVSDIERELFEQKNAEVLIGEENGTPVAFALYYYNFSTFLGRQGIYLEDIFINEENRKNGYGKLMIKELAKVAKSKNAGRIEWRCLKWNSPSIEFYKHLGASELDEWVSLTLDKDRIDQIARQ